MGLRKFYYHYFKTRYFNKLLLVYFAITAGVFLLLGNFVIRSVNEMLIDKEIRYNDIVLLNLNDYFNERSKMVKVILQQTYLDAYARDDIFYFLENEMDSLEYLEKKPIFDNYFFSQFSRSRDILNIYVHKKLDDRIYQFSKSVIADNFPAAQFEYPELLIANHVQNASIVVHPAYSPYFFNEEQHGLAYSMSIPIKRKGSNENIGTLVVEFDPQGFSDILERLDKNIAGQILILLGGTGVIFDSENSYYKQPYPYGELLDLPDRSDRSERLDRLDPPHVRIEDRTMLVNTLAGDIDGITLSSLVPRDAILRSTEDIRQTILALTIVSIVVCMILMFISSNAFSRKVKQVVGAMKDMRSGNMAIRIPVQTASDEIDQIAIGFNRMSSELNNYIERVYLSEIERQNSELYQKNLELRQKSIELSALQARINPHFLYNTLEVIRMKAISSNEPAIADMIYILSDLFRSSLSSKYVVTLEDELAYSELYMNLFRFRYNDQLSYVVQADEGVLYSGIIKHIVQPILENYTIHGYRAGDEDNRVSLNAQQDGSDILIRVQDNGRGIAADRLKQIQTRLADRPNADLGTLMEPEGMGLANVHERLQLVFGAPYGVELESIAGLGTAVTIRYPKLSAKELKTHVETIDRR